MIVWLASFPRSGNTFLRILLHEMYGLTTSTVYDVDGVAKRLGDELVGFRQHTLSFEAMRACEDLFLIKTHRPCDGLVDEADGALCLVRDGRDAMVSWARQRAEQPGRTFEAELRDLVLHPEHRGAGLWGSNVLSWLDAGVVRRPVIQFDRLIAEPVRTVARAVGDLKLGGHLGRSQMPEVTAPTFEELHAIDSRFFRVGRVGTHHGEMPADVREAFLAAEDNRAALSVLGYDR